MSTIKILIGSNGGQAGIYLAKNLRNLGKVFLCGADNNRLAPGKFFVDKQHFLPNCQNADFVERLIDRLNTEKIDIYFPTHSTECRIVALNEEKLRYLTNTRFIISPIETYLALDNKINANKNLCSIGIPVPKVIIGYNCNYPIFMKYQLGSGSLGSSIIKNEELHKAYAKTDNNTCFFQFLEGDEYTVDCLFDKNGVLLGHNQRKRIKMVGGAVTITENNCFEIKPYINRIAEKWKFCGCVNFQYIMNKEVPYFIDINLRYPAGGLALTVETGLDIPKLLVKLLLNQEIAQEALKMKDVPCRMYRYFEEIFE